MLVLLNYTQAKLAAVSNILAELRKDAENPTLSPSSMARYPLGKSPTDGLTERDALLDELKIYGRDPRNADPIFTHEVQANLSCLPAILTD